MMKKFLGIILIAALLFGGAAYTTSDNAQAKSDPGTGGM